MSDSGEGRQASSFWWTAECMVKVVFTMQWDLFCVLGLVTTLTVIIYDYCALRKREEREMGSVTTGVGPLPAAS